MAGEASQRLVYVPVGKFAVGGGHELCFNMHGKSQMSQFAGSLLYSDSLGHRQLLAE